MITVQADAASSEKGHGSSASAAAQAAAQEAMLPHMMEALWQMNVLDIEMTLEKVVDKVLHDRAISKKVCDANRIGAKPKIHEEVLFLHCCCPACTALRRVGCRRGIGQLSEPTIHDGIKVPLPSPSCISSLGLMNHATGEG